MTHPRDRDAYCGTEAKENASVVKPAFTTGSTPPDPNLSEGEKKLMAEKVINVQPPSGAQGETILERAQRMGLVEPEPELPRIPAIEDIEAGGPIFREVTEVEQLGEFLEDVDTAICGSRNEDYGDPSENHARTAALWNAYLDGADTIDAVDVCALNILQKLSRHRHCRKRDNMIDAAGYAANAAVCAR